MSSEATNRSDWRINWGLGLLYTGIISFEVGFIGGDTYLPARVVWTLIRGGSIWVLLFAANSLFIYLSRILWVGRLKSSRLRGVVLNLPAALLIPVIGVFCLVRTSAQARFQDLFSERVPASVQNLHQWQATGMDFRFLVLGFTIAESDLNKLIARHGFVRTNKSLEELKRREETLRDYVDLSVSLDTNWIAFERGTNVDLLVKSNHVMVMRRY